MNDADIRAAIRDACEKNRVAELADKITYRFTSRMTSSAGNANYRTNVIKLSTVYWARANVEDCRQTVYHETCHLIAHYKATRVDQWGRTIERHIQPHGWEWQAAMYACGKRPDRCHTVDMGKSNRHTVYCACGAYQIGPTRYKRMLNGTMHYRCRLCRERLRLYK